MSRFQRSLNLLKRGNYLPFKNNFSNNLKKNSKMDFVDKFKPFIFSFGILIFGLNSIFAESIASDKDIKNEKIVIKEETNFIKYYTHQYLDIVKVAEVEKKL